MLSWTTLGRVAAEALSPAELEAKLALEAADQAEWAGLERIGWGKQLQTLKPRGWEEQEPDYDDMDSQLGKRLFVCEHGFGMLLKAPKKTRGWGPCSVEFVAGGKKTVILRLRGKEMGTPFLVAPAVDPGRDMPSPETLEPRSGGLEPRTVECEPDR